MRSTCRSFPRRCGMVWRRSGITRRLPPRRGKSCSGFSGPSSEREGEGALAAGQAARRPALAAPASHGGWACEELDQDDARDETADVRPESPGRLAQILRPRRADEANVMRSREARGPSASGVARYGTALVRLASNIFSSESAIRRLPMPRLAKPPKPVT